MSGGDARSALRRIAEGLDLTDAELAALFAIDEKVLASWRAAGIPPERGSDIDHVVVILALLERKLKRGRLPLVARRHAEAYGGLSLIEMLSAGRYAEVRASVTDSLDLSTSA